MGIIVFCIVLIVLFKLKDLNLRIDFKSLFKKGFKKIDNKFGIICYTAKQGKGKTYSAVDFCFKMLQENKNLILIVNVKSFYNCLQRTLFRDRVLFFSSIFDIINYINQQSSLKEYIIFFDEIFTVLKKAGSLKSEILSFLSQLRKRKILFVTTAQEWSEINITFRRYVRYHVVPDMFSLPFTNNAFLIKKVNDGDLIHWDNDSQDFIAPCIETQFKKCNKEIIELYDTFETIKMYDFINDNPIRN